MKYENGLAAEGCPQALHYTALSQISRTMMHYPVRKTKGAKTLTKEYTGCIKT